MNPSRGSSFTSAGGHGKGVGKKEQVQHGAVNGFVLNVSSDVIESSLYCSGTKPGVMLSAVSQPGLDPSGTDEPVIVVSYE
jgi:hypothetical protein